MIAGLFAAAFFAFHLPFPAASLEDLDSINFALGVRDFDVTRHQPHPPGYPLYVLAAKGVHALIPSEVRSLSLLSILAATLAAFALVESMRRIDPAPRVTRRAVLATLLTMTAPLYWFGASRPLSDMVGLAAALAVQATILSATSPGGVARGAFLSAFATGIRAQVAWLTMPLLVLALVRRPRPVRAIAAMAAGAAFVAGALVWFIPLAWLSGGLSKYWQVLSTQGAEDLSGVVTLWTTPTPRQLLSGLGSAFVAPWGTPAIAAVVLLLAVAGLVRLVRASDTAALTTLAVAFAPYLAFHMLFQETVTTRYALPLVIPIAYLAVCGVEFLTVRFATSFVPAAIVAGLGAAGVVLAAPALFAYSRIEAPAFRMLGDMRVAALRGKPAVLAMHRRQTFSMRRPIDWAGEAMPPVAKRLPTPPKHEWLELVKYWNNGGRDVVWFVADPLRSDLALFSRGRQRTYRWPFDASTWVGGVRPRDMDWHVIERPDWYLGEGWAITPETAGVANEDGRGPGLEPIRGWVLRRPGPVNLMIGGRNLGGGAAASVRIALDGRTIDESMVPPGFFLRMLTLQPASLAGEGDYSTITAAASLPSVAIEQFDAEPAGRVLFGFGDGWNEQEYDPATGRLWRWMSERGTLRVRAEGHALILDLHGELEASSTSHITIRVGNRPVTEQDVGPSFSVRARIPADMVAAAESAITIETSEWFVPAERSARSHDRRHLGLKVFECRLTPAS